MPLGVDDLKNLLRPGAAPGKAKLPAKRGRHKGAKVFADIRQVEYDADLFVRGALRAQPPIWTPGVSDSFEAHLTVRVPPIQTTRKPGLVETLKLAAVQYIAFFFPIAFLLSCLHSALFRFGVVSARVHNPIKQHPF